MSRLLGIDGLLWLCIGLLLTGLAYEWTRDPFKIPPAVSNQPVAIPAIQKLAVPPSAKSTQLALDAHPLFSPHREMLMAEERPAPTPARPLPDIELRAIIVEGTQRSALFRHRGASESKHMSTGEQIEGWRLVRIEDQAVVLEARGQRHRLALRKPVPDQDMPPGKTTNPAARAGRPLVHSLPPVPGQ